MHQSIQYFAIYFDTIRYDSIGSERILGEEDQKLKNIKARYARSLCYIMHSIYATNISKGFEICDTIRYFDISLQIFGECDQKDRGALRALCGIRDVRKHEISICDTIEASRLPESIWTFEIIATHFKLIGLDMIDRCATHALSYNDAISLDIRYILRDSRYSKSSNEENLQKISQRIVG